MASATRTVYAGVTSNLERRVWEHKAHAREGFTKRYDVTKLVWFEEFPRMDDAIAWEKALKGKTRKKKVTLIEERNPRWNDLAWDWFTPDDFPDNGGAAHECADQAQHGSRKAS
jgi:putative endonuclease